MAVKRKVAAWGMAAVAGLATVVVAPAAAQAAFSDCPANVFCLWADPDGGGRRVSASSGLPDLRVKNFNDLTSSIANNSTTRGICVYPDLNYDGDWAAFIPAWAWTNITDPAADNRVTSVRWAPSSNPPNCWTAGVAGKTVITTARPLPR